MWGISRLLGAVAWWILVVVGWYHSQFLEPVVTWWLDTVLGAWEESVKAFMRESFATATRLLNGTAAWTVSIFFKQGYYETMRKNRRLSAWQAWWADRAKSGTFNSVLERDGLLARSSPAPVFNRLRRSSGRAAGAAGTSPPSQHSQGGRANPPGTPPPRSWLQQLVFGSSGSGHGPGQASPGAGSREGGGLLRGGMKRSGSELFERQSGYGIAEALQRRGLLEDTRLGLELAVTAVFEAMRTAVRTALFLPKQQAVAPFEDGWILRRQQGGSGTSAGITGSTRPSATSRFEDLHVWTASDVILQAGYPLEEHIVTTGDGYVLHMQRIPRKGARDVVFFMHGILDTSLGWVANGVVGSQAFAAWDSGHDVWLGNSRSNPPRAHVDPEKQGARYWCYTLNELGMEDVAAQVEHIHSAKTSELTSGGVWRSAALEDVPSLDGPKAGLRRTSSDSALLARYRLEVAAGRSRADGSEAQQRQHARGSLDRGASNRKSPGLSLHLPPPSEFQDAEEEIATARSAGSHAGRFRLFPFHPFKRSRKRRSAAQALADPCTPLQPGAAQGRRPSYWEMQSPAEPSEQQQQRQQQQQQQQGGGKPMAAKPYQPDELVRSASSIHSPTVCTLTSPGGSSPAHGPCPALAAAAAEGATSQVATPSDRHVASFPLDLASEGSSSGEGLPWFDAAETPSSPCSSSGGGCGSEGGSPRLPSIGRSFSGSPLGASPPFGMALANGTAGTAGVTAGSSMIEEGLEAPGRGASISPGASGPPSSSWQQGPKSHSVSSPRAGLGGLPPADSKLLTPDRVAVQGVEQAPGVAPAPWPWAPAPAPSVCPPQQGAASRAAKLPFSHIRSASLSSSEPYRLRAVGHSLGAASLLIYAVMSKLLGRQHRLKRVVLLTPAGFHVKHPKVFVPFMWVVPGLVRLMDWVRPGMGSPAYLPSSLLRYITFKLSMDLDRIPALNELTRAGISMLLSGDKSEWDRVLQMPHYNTYSMPALSFHTGGHLLQLMKTGRFELYDYGSPAANRAQYGKPLPPDVASLYHLIADLPVDLVAGGQDGIIAAEDVVRHYEAMRRAGLQVSYKEFDVGHLDVTFAVKDDIRHYVLSRLRQSSLFQ